MTAVAVTDRTLLIQNERFRSAIHELAERIDIEAAVSNRSGQLARLERIAAELRALPGTLP